jgi:hypothetical protein
MDPNPDYDASDELEYGITGSPGSYEVSTHRRPTHRSRTHDHARRSYCRRAQSAPGMSKAATSHQRAKDLATTF